MEKEFVAGLVLGVLLGFLVALVSALAWDDMLVSLVAWGMVTAAGALLGLVWGWGKP